MKMAYLTVTGLALVAGSAMAQGDGHEHGDDGIVGVSGAGQLGLEIDTD